MTKKLTKRDHFNSLLAIPAVAENPDLVSFINRELELLNRKNSTPKKKTAGQVANDALRDEILACMVEGQLYTVSEMIKQFPCCEGLSTSKVSAMVNPMVENKILDKVTEKRRSYFRIHEEE